MGFSRQEYWSGVPLPSLVMESKCIQMAGGISLLGAWVLSLVGEIRSHRSCDAAKKKKKKSWKIRDFKITDFKILRGAPLAAQW